RMRAHQAGRKHRDDHVRAGQVPRALARAATAPEIERSDCRALHQQLTSQSGPYLANRVIRHVRAVWNTALKEHDLLANPTIYKERRSRPFRAGTASNVTARATVTMPLLWPGASRLARLPSRHGPRGRAEGSRRLHCGVSKTVFGQRTLPSYR